MPHSPKVSADSLRAMAEAPVNGTLAAVARVRALSNPADRWLPPSFVIAGGQRCGTTSLYRYLSMHPSVYPALTKEVHYFDLNYSRGLNWYASHFVSRNLAAKTRKPGSTRITGEASPYYMFHPLAPARLRSLLPDTKIIVILRDPVERAVSHYKHEFAKGFETADLETALRLEPIRLQGEEEHIVTDERYNSFAHQHYSYLARGDYVPQLQRLFAVFPADQLLVLESGKFYENPHREYQRTLDFLGLPNHSLPAYKRYNTYSAPKPADGTRQLIREHFLELNKGLFELLGEDFGWNC
jgi:hypothetical protein